MLFINHSHACPTEMVPCSQLDRHYHVSSYSILFAQDSRCTSSITLTLFFLERYSLYAPLRVANPGPSSRCCVETFAVPPHIYSHFSGTLPLPTYNSGASPTGIAEIFLTRFIAAHFSRSHSAPHRIIYIPGTITPCSFHHSVFPYTGATSRRRAAI